MRKPNNTSDPCFLDPSLVFPKIGYKAINFFEAPSKNFMAIWPCIQFWEKRNYVGETKKSSLLKLGKKPSSRASYGRSSGYSPLSKLRLVNSLWSCIRSFSFLRRCFVVHPNTNKRSQGLLSLRLDKDYLIFKILIIFS